MVRPTLEADFRPTPLFYLAAEPKAEWPWSPKQSFTAGDKPDGNVCRAELDGMEVPKWLEPSLSDAASAEEEELDRFEYRLNI